MSAYKIQSVILLAFVLLQGALCQPVPQQPPQESEAEAIAHAKFNDVVNEYTPKLVDVARNVLKDEALLKNKDPEIVAFMQSLSWLLIKYDTATRVEKKAEVMEYFGNMAASFENLPKEKVTTNTELMKTTLQHYGLMKLFEELQMALNNIMQG
ncbi:hypothetical protein DOY81_000503 [Sarcophaga bullata]|nr:hypothetical protein DOY81_000503 [Sarcophaga bullata]